MPLLPRQTGRHSNPHHWPTAMVYSYTQISPYLRCPRSYRYRYLDGWQEKETRQRWSLAAALKRLSAPTFAKRIALLCFSKNGMLTTMLRLNSARESPGIASSTRESIYSKHLRGILGFELAVRRRICKSNCFEHYPERVNSLLILMPSGRSMANTA